MTNLNEIKDSANSILKHEITERHSLYQLQCFILGKEPTIQGKLHQCLREIKSRKNSLDALELELEEQKDKLELVSIDMAETQEAVTVNDFAEKRKIIRIRSFERQCKSLENNIKELNSKQKNISEELQFFCSAFDQLNRREQLKPWDDMDVQNQYWSDKLRTEVNTRLLLRQLPDIELLKTIMALHDDSPVKKGTVEMLKKAGKQIADAQKALEEKDKSKG